MSEQKPESVPQPVQPGAPQAQGAPRPAPAFDIAYPPSLAHFNVPPLDYIATHYPPNTYNETGTSAFIFDSSNRVLLLRRAQHDSMPGLWEPPGGAADHDDKSLFVSCARELWEEAGLEAKRIVRIVSEGKDKKPGTVFTNRTGERVFVKFVFEVDVASREVQIDPNEHDAFVWATEEGIKEKAVAGVEGMFELTHMGTRELVYDAFRRRREEPTEEPMERVACRSFENS